MSTSASTTPAPPVSADRRRRQVMIFRIVNVPMRRVLGLPFRTPLSKNLMLVHLTGRRTGKHYRQPVSYVRDGDTLLTPGGGKWKLNLVPGRQEKIRLGRRDNLAPPGPGGGPAHRRPVLR